MTVLPIKPVSTPKPSARRSCYSQLVEAAGALFVIHWEGSWWETPSEFSHLERVEAVVISALLSKELTTSTFLTCGQNAQIRHSKDTNMKFPILKIAHPNDVSSRQQISSEYSILSKLQGLGFHSVEVDPVQLEDELGIFGFRMCQLRPVLLEEVLSRLCELETLVEELHDMLIVHGDLSLSNIMKDDDGVLRLIDFGSAGQLGEDLPCWNIFRITHKFEKYHMDMDAIRLAEIKQIGA